MFHFRTVLAAVATLFIAADAFSADGTPPNLVVFISDDHSYLDSSAVGASEFRTPNLERLAKDGMTFTHAFAASPTCAPSRAALLTGLMPLRNGSMLNHQPPRADVKKLPAYLQELGYEVVAFGKVAHYKQGKDYGFDHVSHDGFHDDECVAAAVEFLQQRTGKQPLCLLVGTNWPHVPWPEIDAQQETASYRPPPSHVDTPVTRAWRARYAAAVERFDRDLGLVYDAANERLGQNTLFLHFSDQGAQWPFGKWNLYDAGARVPFFAVWPGVIRPESRSDAMLSLIDVLPTLIEVAGGEAPSEIDGRSIVEVLTGKRSEHRERIFTTHSGDGRMNAYPIRSVRTRRWNYIRNLTPDEEHHTHINRGKAVDGNHFWMSWSEAAEEDAGAAAIVERYHRRPAEELYDLHSDPHELHNLAADPRHADTLERLRAELDDWMRSAGDEGIPTENAAAQEFLKPQPATVSKTNQRPNFVLVMADDMGFSDIGCYGGEIETPTLNRLATDGLRFTQFYNTSRCCPTRAALLTGVYPHQAGVGHMMSDQGWPAYRGELNPKCATIAEVLGAAGYATYMTGKWHVTKHVGHWTGNERLASKHNWPRARGFEKFFGTIHGGGSFFDPVTLTRDNTPVSETDDDFYYTDAINDQAAEFVRGHASRGDRPFFLYVAHTAPHWPLHALPEDVARYDGRFDAGWDVLRTERHRRMVESGILRQEWEPAPRDPEVPPWDETPHREWQARRMEVYAAQIDRLDQGLARLVTALRETGQLENTVFFFLADNGGCAEEITEKWSGLHIPETTRRGQPVLRGNRPDLDPGPETTYQSYGQGWANLSNTPFRQYKHWVHEGGVASPLIVHWPKGLQARGELRHQVTHVIDIMPTCLDLAGVDYPDQKRGQDPSLGVLTPFLGISAHALTPLEGQSLRAAFADQAIQRRPLFWEHEGNRAVRVGRWKLVSRFHPNTPVRWELYDMAADRAETNDLAAAHLQRVERMAALWEAWAERCGVRPWPVRPPTATSFSGLE